ncbi:MAG TPA: protein kinase [Pyrinomonadaceae bacterium]|nr:protein kinase [Pyrinomonadaceae bacterium]
MAISNGTKLGHYEVRSKLGAGAMGEVYLAEDLSLHRKVAIKVLPPSVTANEARLQRFNREAQTASSLNHPNILTVYEIGTEGEYEYIVTEFIDGESLRQRQRRGPFTLNEALDIGTQAASALAAAHAAGIMHRDIKPENIMLREDGVVKVLDFGLAKLSESDEHAVKQASDPEMQLTLPGAIMGTARYMSPEQARAQGVDTRTDIWSLGVVLYEMVAGHVPFAAQTMGDVLVAILTVEPKPLSAYSATMPGELDRIVKKALMKNKDERYQLAKDLGLDLKNLRQRLEFAAQFTGSTEQLVGTGSDPMMTMAYVGDRSTANPAEDISTTPSLDAAKLRLPGRRRLITTIVPAIVVSLLTLSYFVYSRYWHPAKSAAISSLAVLPFANSNNDPDQEYLSDGISESLINRLSQLPGIKVIANSSTMKYKGKDTDPADIANELGVSGIITGRISQRGDDLLISVELIDGRDRTQVWGEKYQRKATDLQAVQAEITSEVADKMRLSLTTSQQVQAAKADAVNPEAYELLLKGRAHRSREGTEDRKKAAEYFKTATEVDPKYALAYAELAGVYRSLIGSSALDPKEYLPKATDAARRSLDLDPNLPEGHYALANLKVDTWAWNDAEQEYKRAIELNSNLALAHRYYAVYLSYVGQHDQALAEIKKAQELDPLSNRIHSTYCQLLYFARQYDSSIAELQKSLGQDANNSYTYFLLANNYVAKGMHEEAINAYQKALDLGLSTANTRIYLATEQARSGKKDQAQKLLAELQASKQYVSPADLAVLYDALGEREKAFASLDTAYKNRDLQLQFVGTDPRFDSLRSDTRFKDLVRRVGLQI